MPPVLIGTGTEGQPITVNALWRDPLRVPMMLRRVLEGQFIMDQVLRYAGSAPGGAVQFWEASTMFPQDDPEILSPDSEVPVTLPFYGEPRSVVTRKGGLGLRITREMVDANNIGAVELGMQAIRDSMIRLFDGRLLTALRNSVTQTVAVGAPWGAATGTTILKDLTAADNLVENQRDSGFNYRLDTLLVSRTTRNNLRQAPELSSRVTDPAPVPLIGTQVDQRLSTQLGYRVLVSPQLVNNEAYLIQSGVIGGRADRRPMEVSDMFVEPAYDFSQRWNVIRDTAAFIDNPRAGVKLTGT